MKTHKTLLLIITFGSLKLANAQKFQDTTLNNNQFFGGFGASVYGYTPQTISYFSFYWIYGLEWDISENMKYGVSLNAFKFNWTRLDSDSTTYKGKFDKVRYFSFSTDLQVFARKVLSRTSHPNKPYNTYLEFGAGYNIPFFFSLDKIKGNKEISEEYPNRFNDFYIYSEFYFYEPVNLPIGLKLEYHPFDIIRNNIYPNVAEFRINIEILLHDADHK